MVHREEASKTQKTGHIRNIFINGLFEYLHFEESSLFALHTRDFLASLNSTGF